MPARIVVVLRDHALAGRTAECLANAGYEAIAISSALTALDTLEAAREVELLITSAEFPDRQPNGLALARITRRRRPNLKVIFANGVHISPYVAKDGTFIPTPTTPETIVAAADALMRGS